MPGAYTDVKGAVLVGLIHETRDTFLARPPIAAFDPKLPNSLRLVALEVFSTKPRADQLEVLGDLIEADVDLPIERASGDVFVHAGTAGAYVADLICEIVCQALYDEPHIRTEDERRVRIAQAAKVETD
jgi:hypothetical protein